MLNTHWKGQTYISFVNCFFIQWFLNLSNNETTVLKQSCDNYAAHNPAQSQLNLRPHDSPHNWTKLNRCRIFLRNGNASLQYLAFLRRTNTLFASNHKRQSHYWPQEGQVCSEFSVFIWYYTTSFRLYYVRFRARNCQSQPCKGSY